MTDNSLDIVLATAELPKVLELGGCSFEPKARRLKAPDGGEAHLTPAGAIILAALWCAPGRYLSRQDLYRALYGDRVTPSNPYNNVVSVHLGRLRRVLPRPLKIQTIYRSGYELLVVA